MALSKVNAPHHAPASGSLCLFKTGHRGTSGLYGLEEQGLLGLEVGVPMGCTTGGGT